MPPATTDQASALQNHREIQTSDQGCNQIEISLPQFSVEGCSHGVLLRISDLKRRSSPIGGRVTTGARGCSGMAASW
jgi:hypothetical protein